MEALNRDFLEPGIEKLLSSSITHLFPNFKRLRLLLALNGPDI